MPQISFSTATFDSEPKLFEEPNRQPQWPAQCLFPSEELQAEPQRRLGERVSMWDAEQACARHGSRKAKEACLSDVIAMNDLDLAHKIAY